MTNRPFRGRAWLALAALVLLACHDEGPVRLALRPGLAVTDRIHPGSVRGFAFALRRGQYLALTVSQDEVDVALTLQPPNGERWPALDTQTVVPQPEVLRVVAPHDGRYLLQVEAADEDEAGRFRLEVAELRPSAPRDRLLVAAQNHLARAEELRRRKGEATDLQALPLYEQAVRLYRQAGEADGESYARGQWARVLARRSRAEEAADTLRVSLTLLTGAQALGTRARAATLLAEVLSVLGRSAEADAAARQALALWTRLERPDMQAKVLNEMAHRASERGELAGAESLYRRAVGLWEKSGDATSAAVALGNLAAVYTLAGEPRLALDAAEQGLARIRSDASSERAGVLAQKAEALASLGRRQDSQRAFAEALQLRRQGTPAELAQLERRLARRAYDEGNFDEAARKFESALAALEAAEDLPSAVATRQDLAWTELKRGHLEAAERLFERTSAEAPAGGNRWLRPAALAGRARLEQARGRLEAALDLALQALDEVELLRREVGRTDLVTSVFANQQSYFELAADLTLQLHGRTGRQSLLVKAFEISERSRARRLLDLLAGREPASAGPPEPGAETSAAKALNEAEQRLRALQSAGAAPADLARAERQVRTAVLALRREEEPSSAAPGFGGSPLSFREIQSWIDRDTVLLEFDLGEDASSLWVITRQELAVYPLPPRRQIEELAGKALDVLSAPGVSAQSVQSRETLQRTARLLLGQVRTRLTARRWLLVMDGALHALPLGALPDPAHPGRPVLASHEIAYAPSASVAVRLSERERRNREIRKELAVFADPVYEAAGGSASGLLRLPSLQYSDDEARRILAFVEPEARLDAQRWDAAKARVRSGELEGCRRLHFAVHGLPNEDHPELSGLALSLVDRQGRPTDGILYAHEIARLRLPADLAVLSACRSGRGAAVSGEGLIGLTHAFFTAGTARVVASAWAVNDQATTELMSLFYDGLLRQGMNPARALQQAQLTLSRQGPWRRPYYWAAFVVQGGF
jgi:CHAT domain-containing protein